MHNLTESARQLQIQFSEFPAEWPDWEADEAVAEQSAWREIRAPEERRPVYRWKLDRGQSTRVKAG